MGGPSAQALAEAAARLARAGKPHEAIAALEQIVRRTPEDATAHFNLGLAYFGVGRLAAAVAGFRNAINLKPTFADALFNLGLALEELDQPQDAIDAFRRAVELKPRMAAAHYRLGGLLNAGGEREQAARSYSRVAAIAPQTIMGRLAKARVLMAEQKTTDAEACLRRAIALDPNDGALHWLLATVSAEAGRFAEAEASFRRTIDLDPTRIAVYRDLLQFKKLTASDRPLLTRMTELFDRGGFPETQRAELLFALGKGHDDLGDYADAMRRFDEARGLLRRSAVFDREAWARRADALIAAFTPEFLARNAALGAADARPVLILGLPRSGTTLVEQILSSHPGVAAGGELRFWQLEGDALDAADLAGSSVRAVDGLAAAYRLELERISPDAARVTDKNPYNFAWIGLIHLVFPNARIIHCQRDPVDTCLSLYATPFSDPTDYAHDRDDLVFYYRQYRRLMEHWRSALPRGVMLDAPYEDLVAAPEAWSRKLVAFAGLAWDPACLRPEANPRSINTASRWQARQPIYSGSVDRWRRYEPWLGALRDLLSPEG